MIVLVEWPSRSCTTLGCTLDESASVAQVCRAAGCGVSGGTPACVASRLVVRVNVAGLIIPAGLVAEHEIEFLPGGPGTEPSSES